MIKSYRASGQKFEEKRIWLFAKELCQALHYLHENNILHRDIKASNVFLTKDLHVKVRTSSCKSEPYHSSHSLEILEFQRLSITHCLFRGLKLVLLCISLQKWFKNFLTISRLVLQKILEYNLKIRSIYGLWDVYCTVW